MFHCMAHSFGCLKRFLGTVRDSKVTFKFKDVLLYTMVKHQKPMLSFEEALKETMKDFASILPSLPD